MDSNIQAFLCCKTKIHGSTISGISIISRLTKRELSPARALALEKFELDFLTENSSGVLDSSSIGRPEVKASALKGLW